MEGLHSKAAENERSGIEMVSRPKVHLPLRSRTWIILAIAVLLILIAAIYIRTFLLRYPGFSEPDGFYHYAVIRYAVGHGFSVPVYLGLSGWPASTPVAEPSGLYWITLLPYALLQHLGVSYYTVMRLVPVLFGLLDVIGAYYLARFISKDRVFLLLVMAFIALSVGNATKTMALSYRGDGFASIFLILALITSGLIINGRRSRRKLFYSVLGAVSLSLCSLVWNGAPFATVVYILSFVLLASYSFIADRKELFADSAYLLIAIALWFVLVSAYAHAGLYAQSYQALTGFSFIAVLAALAIGWLALRWLMSRSNVFAFMRDPKRRLAVLILFVVVGTIAFYVVAYGFLYSVFLNNILAATQGNVLLATIQELIRPNFPLLFSNFNVAIFLSPMGIMMALSAAIPTGMVLFFAALLMSTVIYMRMRVYDSGGWLTGSARFTSDIRPEVLILVSYLAVTAYLQMSAARFSSVVSIPLAIFSAFTLYWFVLYVKKHYASTGGMRPYLIAGAAVAAVLLAMAYYAVIYAQASPNDSIVPYMLNATAWLRSSTPANSVVLTLWPDGSVVEGWGNRTSVTDSVGSQNITKIGGFAAWLLNTSNDPGFLESNMSSRPDYLLVRSLWFEETRSIFEESGLNGSLAGAYGTEDLSLENESENGTRIDLIFSGIGIHAYVYTVKSAVTNAFLTYGNASVISPVSYVAFYNPQDGNFSIQTNRAYNTTNGQMLLVDLSLVPGGGAGRPANITGAMLIGQRMVYSNLLKLVYFCNSYQCEWNSSAAHLRLVYPNRQTGFNPDVRIYRVVYNST